MRPFGCGLHILVFACVVAWSLAVSTSARSSTPTDGVYQFTMKNIDGKSVPLGKYHGKVLLIVNVASLCGNTPQYAKLEDIYNTYRKQGLRILGFPANNFHAQEPGDNQQIKEFCTSTYHVTFDMFSKISVKGDDQDPLYKYLTDKSTDPKFGGDIDWNFAKFIIGRNGEILARFPAHEDPTSPDVIAALQSALAQK
jgi:glutathione peroxidase